MPKLFLTFILFHSSSLFAAPFICKLNRMNPYLQEIYSWRETGKDRQTIINNEDQGEKLAVTVIHQDRFISVEVRELHSNSLFFSQTIPSGFEQANLTGLEFANSDYSWFVRCKRKQPIF